MSASELRAIAPWACETTHSEAEIFGSVVWLWMHAKSQADMPLRALSSWLLPALASKQFLLVCEVTEQRIRPVAYMAWAQLNAEAESRYVDNPASGLNQNDWCSGERIWITDFFAPFGHAKELSKLITATYADFCFRALYHRGADRGMRVLYFRGDHMSLEQAKTWWKNKPILSSQFNKF